MLAARHRVKPCRSCAAHTGIADCGDARHPVAAPRVVLHRDLCRVRRAYPVLAALARGARSVGGATQPALRDRTMGQGGGQSAGGDRRRSQRSAAPHHVDLELRHRSRVPLLPVGAQLHRAAAVDRGDRRFSQFAHAARRQSDIGQRLYGAGRLRSRAAVGLARFRRDTAGCRPHPRRAAGRTPCCIS